MADRILISPDGKRGAVDESEVAEALANGYQEEGGGGLPEWAVPAAVGAGGVALVGAGAYGAGKAIGAAGRAIRERPALANALQRAVPGGGNIRGAIDAVNEMRGAGAPPPEALPPATAPVAPPAPRGMTALTARDIAEIPAFAGAAEGDHVTTRVYERNKFPDAFQQAGSAAGRAASSTPAVSDATSRPSFSVSTGQEIPTVSASGVTVTKGRPSKIGGVIKGGKAEAPATGSAANRASGGTPASPASVPDAPDADATKVPKWQGGKMSEAGQRHDMKYWSEGRAQHLDFEDMQQSHLLNAIKKLETKLAGKSNPGETTVRSLENALAELKHRVSTGAITVGDTPKAGGAAGRAARAADAIAEAEGLAGGAARRAGGGKAALGGLAALLGMSMLSGRAQAAGVDEDTMNELSQGLPDMFDNPDAAGALAGMRLARQHGRPTAY